MKTLITKIFNGENGPKIFYADYKRVQLLFSPINSFPRISKDIEKSFKDDAGVYILVGEDDNGNSTVYIGETDSLKRRFIQHKDKMQKYNDLIFIYSNHEMRPYSKTDLLYLEKKIISKFGESDFVIENSNKGQGKLPTALDKIDLNEELDLIFKALESFNINIEKSNVINESSIAYTENIRNINFHPDGNKKIDQHDRITFEMSNTSKQFQVDTETFNLHDMFQLSTDTSNSYVVKDRDNIYNHYDAPIYPA